MADEAVGKVTGMGLGSFKLDEKGTVRQFNLSRQNSVFDPTLWRPGVGDEVTVTFMVKQGKRGTVLEVSNVKLNKAGPDTVISLASPAEVEITEVGRSGVKAKIATGQIVKFAAARGVRWVPTGWVPTVGQKARIEFSQTTSPMSFGVVFAASKIEKMEDKAQAAP